MRLMHALVAAPLVVALIAFAAIFAPPAAASTAGSGRAAVETRSVAGFDAIAVSGSLSLVVRSGAKEALQIEGDDNLLPLVETVVEGRRLVVRVRRGESIRPRLPITVTVDVVKLAAVAMSGSGDVRIGALKTLSLSLSLAGSGDALVEGLDAGRLAVSISGSGDVTAAGRATALEVSIAGSGDARFAALAADDVKVSIAGSGDVAVNAAKSLDVSIAGSGDVHYGGAVTDVRSRVAGSGAVRRQ